MALPQPPIRVPAPPKSERPLCMGCGKPLRPAYAWVFEDGTVTSAISRWQHDTKGRSLFREWRGEYDGVRVKGELPTHCSITCAGWYGVRMASVIIHSIAEGHSGATTPTPDGYRRASLNRPSKAADAFVNAARDVVLGEASEAAQRENDRADFERMANGGETASERAMRLSDRRTK